MSSRLVNYVTNSPIKKQSVFQVYFPCLIHSILKRLCLLQQLLTKNGTGHPNLHLKLSKDTTKSSQTLNTPACANKCPDLKLTDVYITRSNSVSPNILRDSTGFLLN